MRRRYKGSDSPITASEYREFPKALRNEVAEAIANMAAGRTSTGVVWDSFLGKTAEQVVTATYHKSGDLAGTLWYGLPFDGTDAGLDFVFRFDEALRIVRKRNEARTALAGYLRNLARNIDRRRPWVAGWKATPEDLDAIKAAIEAGRSSYLSGFDRIWGFDVREAEKAIATIAKCSADLKATGVKGSQATRIAETDARLKAKE